MFKRSLLFFVLTMGFTLFGQADHLLLTEVVLTPTDGEYVEIANFTGAEVSLANYYLSDDMDYALLPGASGDGPVPDIGTSDFLVKFPDDAVIMNGEVLVIAFSGTGFNTTYTLTADFEIKGTDDLVADMEMLYGSASSGLTNSGEQVTLFYWDGESDLVMDVDMAIIGTPSSSNTIANKTEISVDGPDADSDASNYLTDAFTMPQMESDPGFGFSAKRIDFEGDEVATGGNGITGHDETTEDITVTWDAGTTAPDPGYTVLETLPVELTSFSANVVNNSVSLNWSTATELNNSGFEVQRALDGSDFEAISFVDGFGTTTEFREYSFTDNSVNAGKYQYRLKQIDYDGSFEYSNVIEVNVGTPVQFELAQNYPNPFNPSTKINFSTPEAGNVKLVIYNLIGESVAEVVNTNMEAGYHTVSFNAANLPSGIYFYTLSAGQFNQTKKMTLMK